MGVPISPASRALICGCPNFSPISPWFPVPSISLFFCQLPIDNSSVSRNSGHVRRSRHPNREIERVLRFAEARGFRVQPGGSHCWGQMYCPYNSTDCRGGGFCRVSVWSTPSKSRQSRQAASACGCQLCFCRGAERCLNITLSPGLNCPTARLIWLPALEALYPGWLR